MASPSSDLIVITGASRGLGSELALQSSRQGVIMLLIARDETALNQIAQTCRKRGATVYVMGADLTKSSFTKAYRDILTKATLGQINRFYLYNNASIIEPIKQLVNTTKTSQKKLLSVNLETPIWLSSEFLKYCRKLNPNESYIVNISSGVSLKPVEGWSLYCISKAGVNMLTACIHEETKNWIQKVYAVAINPGALNTDMQGKIRASDSNESAASERFRIMHQNNQLKPPHKAAKEVLDLLNERPFPNGQFIDMNLRQ